MKKNLFVVLFVGASFYAGAQNVGIGTLTPLTSLHIRNGASGAIPFAFSPLAVESNGHTYINILSPAANEGAILFGQPGSSANGVIMYNNTNTPNGFQFRNNGNQTRMVIDNAGNVGIGTSTPNAPLSFPPALGKKITLYPGATGDVGFGVAGNRLQIYSDSPNADVAIGYDAAGVFNERFAVKPNGALAVNGTTGNSGQLLRSNGPGNAASWVSLSPGFYDQTFGSIMTLQNALTVVDGIDNQSFVVNSSSDLIITFNGVVTNSSITNIDQNPAILTIIKASGSGIEIGRMNAHTRLGWSASFEFYTDLTSSFHIKNVAAGSYFITCKAQKYDGSGITSLMNSQVRVQIFPH